MREGMLLSMRQERKLWVKYIQSKQVLKWSLSPLVTSEFCMEDANLSLENIVGIP